MSRDPSRLVVSVTHADGTVSRFAPDEPDAENIAANISFSTSVPGSGFKDGAFVLNRSLTRTYADESLFDNVSITGPGGEVAWQGYVAQLPREQGETASVTVGCLGWSAALKWNTFREIYRDPDISHWNTEPSIARRAALLAGGTKYMLKGTSETVWDTGTPALRLKHNDSYADATYKPLAEVWYDAQGIGLGSVYYYGATAQYNGALGADWTVAVLLSSDDLLTANDTTGDIGSGASGTLSTSGARKFAALQMYYTTTYAGDSFDRWADFYNLVAYGTHGLTKRGTEPDAGFYASDIIANAVSRTCSFLDTSGVDDTSFVVPYAVFTDPTDAGSVIEQMNAYHLYDWGVYEGPRGYKGGLFFRAPDASRLTWQARLADGAKLSLEGDDATADIINGMVVRYTDFYGKQKVYAPTGYSPADNTSADLLDSSETNPVNSHGLGNKYGLLELSNPTSDDAALQIGSAALAQKLTPRRRGSITLTGTVRHPTEGMVPVWRVRAGDWIVVTDRTDDVVRQITDTTYDHESRTLTATIGGTPQRLDAIMERIGIFYRGLL